MESFETMYENYNYLIYAAVRYVKVYTDYEDYVQIATGAFYEAYVNFDEEKGKFSSYAYAMMIGRLRTEMTRNNRYQSRRIVISPQDFSQYESKLQTTQIFETLEFESYTKLIPKAQADVITERFLYHNDVKTTAKRLNISETTVKNRTRCALATLRQHLSA